MNKKMILIILLLVVTILPANYPAQNGINQLASAVVGQWRGSMSDGKETRTFDLSVNAADGKVSGEIIFDEGTVPIPAFIFGNDNAVSFEIPQIMKFSGTVMITTGTTMGGTGNQMSGEVTVNSQKGSWLAHKVISGGGKLNTAKEYATRGEIHFKNKAYKEGIGDFTEALRLEKTAILYISRGMIYKNEAASQSASANNTSASLGAFLDKPVAVAPTNARLSLDLAIDDLSKAIKINPNISQGFYGRGLARLDKCNLTEGEIGECRRAVDDFSQTIKLNPNTAAIYTNRALAYKKLGMSAEALADEQKAARLK